MMSISAMKRARHTMTPAIIPTSRLRGSAAVGLGLGANSHNQNKLTSSNVKCKSLTKSNDKSVYRWCRVSKSSKRRHPPQKKIWMHYGSGTVHRIAAARSSVCTHQMATLFCEKSTVAIFIIWCHIRGHFSNKMCYRNLCLTYFSLTCLAEVWGSDTWGILTSKKSCQI